MSETRPFVAAALVLGVFVAGLVSGGALVYLGGRGDHGPPHGRPPHHGPGGPGGPGRHHGPPSPEHIVEKLREHLDLDEAQVQQVRGIVVEQEAAVQAAMASSRPTIEAALQAGEDRIKATLRPEQREAFDGFVRERRERFPDGPRPPH